MPRGRPRKQKNDIPDLLVESFIELHPNGASSADIARFLGEPISAFIAEVYRLERKLATLGKAYA